MDTGTVYVDSSGRIRVVLAEPQCVVTFVEEGASFVLDAVSFKNVPNFEAMVRPGWTESTEYASYLDRAVESVQSLLAQLGATSSVNNFDEFRVAEEVAIGE